MATSRNTVDRTGRTASRRTLGPLLSLSRYDAVLAAIPLVFALALAAHALAGLSVHLAVAAGVVASAPILVDAIYLNPPVDAGSGRSPHRE